jgi:hypothetical protein
MKQVNTLTYLYIFNIYIYVYFFSNLRLLISFKNLFNTILGSIKTQPLTLSIRRTVNNFMDWPYSGAVMHYSGYVEPRDGAVSILLLSQQEAVVCIWCIQKEHHCCEV